ncbi:MAG: hypothetical protein JNK79_01930 [Chitinophagaceae bacterium]|nr:hypothetical protein [Chitinophagaceae bacterium]
MNYSQIHLALTHVPVVLSIVGLIVLALAMFKRNDTLNKTAFYFLIFAGLFSIPVFLTGEGAEEAVEHLPGVSESIIESHEEFAKLAFSVVGVAGIFSVAALVFYNSIRISRLLKPLVLLLSLTSASLMTVTAHFGGQVRHTEIRSGATVETGGKTSNDVQSNASAGIDQQEFKK